MRLGLTSITFRDKSVEEIIALCTSTGLNTIEWGGDVHVPSGNVERAQAVKVLCDEAGIRCDSYGSYYKGTSLEDFIPVLDCAQLLETKVIRIWAGRIAPDSIQAAEFDLLVEHLQAACDAAADLGIDLGLEYHRRSMTQTKEGTLKLIKAVNRKNLKTYWQPNPELSFDEHLEEIKVLAPYLITMHVFHWGSENERYLLSEKEGIEKWLAYYATARLCGCEPNALIEYVKDDDVENLEFDAASLKVLTKKPVALFMGNAEEIKRVYHDASKERIILIYDLYEEVITLDNWDEYFDVLEKTRVIFSTWGMLKIDAQALSEKCPNLKALFYAAGSVHTFASPFIQQGIQLFSGVTANAQPVAELVSSMILLANKGFFQSVGPHNFESFDRLRQNVNHFPGNKNVKVGLIGAGAVGQMVLAKLADTDLEVYVADPFIDEDRLKQMGAKKADLDFIFSQCQTISNHLPNLPTTKGLLNATYFSKMLPTAIFINTGRGASVVEADLIRALKERPNRLAILDVSDPEPPVKDSPLYALANVILTPHLAGSIGNEVHRLAETMVLAAEDYLCLKPNETKIDPKTLNKRA